MLFNPFSSNSAEYISRKGSSFLNHSSIFIFDKLSSPSCRIRSLRTNRSINSSQKVSFSNSSINFMLSFVSSYSFVGRYSPIVVEYSTRFLCPIFSAYEYSFCVIVSPSDTLVTLNCPARHGGRVLIIDLYFIITNQALTPFIIITNQALTPFTKLLDVKYLLVVFIFIGSVSLFHLMMGIGLVYKKRWSLRIFKGYLNLLYLGYPLGTYLARETLNILNEMTLNDL